jgi:hypothetical protein
MKTIISAFWWVAEYVLEFFVACFIAVAWVVVRSCDWIVAKVKGDDSWEDDE